jgi:dolichol-phosphate mannosyltransferase
MPSVTIVIPMQNEAGNVAPVIAEIAEAMIGAPAWEIIVVDDGSTDATPEELAEAARRTPELRLLSNERAAGKSAAIHNAVLAARSDIICTIDGDGQNPAAELTRLFGPLLADTSGNLGLVAGQRRKRRDSSSKKVASRIANGLRSRLLGDGTRDTACGLKAFRRDGWLALLFFDNMHRFLPALFRRDGWEILLVDVDDRDRLSGRSKYTNVGRAAVGIVDILGVAWLIHRRRKAMATEALQEAQAGAAE